MKKILTTVYIGGKAVKRDDLKNYRFKNEYIDKVVNEICGNNSRVRAE